MTVIVDLGCANLASVGFALDRLGAQYKISREPREILAADRIILPGVGAARFATDQIDALDLRQTLSSSTQPIFGVCLGMQLLFESSQEGGAACLGLLRGKVKRFAPTPERTWPHIGWTRLLATRSDSRLLAGVRDGAYAYFVHGYYCPIGDATVASADYGEEFSGVVEQGNIYGCQFHPERSSDMGAQIIKNFLEVPC